MSDPVQGRWGYLIEPLDTLFFRDGRPFDPATRASSGGPAPQTVAGAIRTWLMTRAGCDFEQLREDVRTTADIVEAARRQSDAVAEAAAVALRGPWFTVADEPVIAMPASLRVSAETGDLVRLDPLPSAVPGWQPPLAEMLPLWHRGRETLKPQSGYLTFKGLRRFLDGGVPDREDRVPADDLYDFDRRTGIEVEPDALTAREGMIYAVSLLALRPGVSLYVEVIPQHSASSEFAPSEGLIKLGGEGRYARLRRLEQPVAWPRAELGRREGGTMIVLTTPAHFDAGWRPGWMSPIAAAVPGYSAVSGWDLARGGPKPTRFAAEAGSVYFLKEAIGQSDIGGSICSRADAADGWGSYVEGVWTYA